MIIKTADNKKTTLASLEQLRQREDISETQRQAIEREIKIMRAGIKGEDESSYLIDFDFRSSKMTAVIHDLRLDINGRVAQIDHLLIHRTLTVFVLETKHFHSGIKITEEGEFLRWNDFKKSFEGMASPLAQNDRHIDVLKDAFDAIAMPTRFGIRLSPTYESYVLASANARIDRPKRFDSSKVIKADVLLKTIEKQFDKESILDTLGSIGKFVSTETIETIARDLCKLHRPISVNYLAKFGLSESPTPPTPAATVTSPELHSTTSTNDESDTSESTPAAKIPICRACSSVKMSVQYGKFGYYFKCADCGGNTPIKITCGIDVHKERIRKDGMKFYRECADCQTSSLFFQNTV